MGNFFGGGWYGTANQCGKFGKIRKNLENRENSGGGTGSKLGWDKMSQNFSGGGHPYLVIPPLLPRYALGTTAVASLNPDVATKSLTGTPIQKILIDSEGLQRPKIDPQLIQNDPLMDFPQQSTKVY